MKFQRHGIAKTVPLSIFGGMDMNREEIVLNANAKINLSLDVLRRRSDGYHEVDRKSVV